MSVVSHSSSHTPFNGFRLKLVWEVYTKSRRKEFHFGTYWFTITSTSRQIQIKLTRIFQKSSLYEIFTRVTKYKSSEDVYRLF